MARTTGMRASRVTLVSLLLCSSFASGQAFLTGPWSSNGGGSHGLVSIAKGDFNGKRRDLAVANRARFAVAGAPQSTPGELSNEAEIVNLIGAAEALYFRTNGRYATFAQLVKSGSLEQAASQTSHQMRAFQAMNLQSDVEPVAGFTLGLVVASDGASYKASLIHEAQTCPSAWFTDNTGTLYEGKAVGCAVAVTALAVPRSLPRQLEWPSGDEAVLPIRINIRCPLPQILEEARKGAQEFVENLQRFSASERIEHIEVGKNGKTRSTNSQVVDYVAEVEVDPSGSLSIDEYRSGPSEIQEPPLSDTGTAGFAMIFHARHIGNFDVRCEGLTDMRGSPAWLVHFEEHANPAQPFHAMRIKGIPYHLRLKGRAWIATDSYEVVHMETDLVAPIPQINLQMEHLDITYAPVAFEKKHLLLWLPESAALYIDYRGHRYARVHTFKKFQLFSVDANQNKEVKPKNHGPSP